MVKAIEMAGLKFGSLTVVERSKTKTGNGAFWDCICDCGSELSVLGTNLRRGNTASCGCAKIKHGHSVKGSETGTYQTWLHMRQRCLNMDNDSFDKYGGRGIGIDKEWDSFNKFLEDMGERPKGMTIDRIDNNGDYTKENCRWATKKTQQRNRRVNHVIKTPQGEKCIAEAAEIYGMDQNVVRARINYGWEPEKALTTPVKSK